VAADVSRTDLLTATACGAAGAVLTVLRAPHSPGWAPPWLELVAQLVAAGALLGRRRWPLGVLGVCVALSFVAPPIAALGALHGVGRFCPSRQRRSVAAVLAIGFTWPSWLVTSESTGPALLWGFTVVVLAAYFVGSAERAQAETHRQAMGDAAEAARAAERSALARELHDVVSHRISYSVIEAGVIASTTHDEDARAMARSIADEGRSALAEMRTVLSALVSGSATGDVAGPSVDDLVADARGAGQPVTAQVDLPPRTPPDLVDRTIVRVVGESLTNAVRHAPGTPTSVRVSPGRGDVEVVVENARPVRPATGLSTGGFGLTGLRERAELLGGTLEAGPTASGGFRVCARLPRKDA